MTHIETGVAVAFALVNSLRLLAYIPQILRVARDQSDVAGVACSTWLMFLASNLTTVAYAAVVVRDATMALVFIGNAVACALIVSMTCWQRYRYARRGTHRGASPTPA